jgi:Uma2 family endonuclease
MTVQPVENPTVTEQRFPMSYQSFLQWVDDSTHAEWVRGEVIVFMPPTTIHQLISIFLSTVLKDYVDMLNLGTVLTAPFEVVILPDQSYREPDIIFVASHNLHRLTGERLHGPPDLIIEIVSASSATRDYREKWYEYQHVGVPEYWIIDPRPGHQHVSVYQYDHQQRYQTIAPDSQGCYHSQVIPGFWFSPDWLWHHPLPATITTLATIAPHILRGALE